METLAKTRKSCPHCGKITTFQQKRESINWVLHLLLMIVTGGLWIPVFLFAVAFSVVRIGLIRGEWVCSECGYVDREAVMERRRAMKVVSLAWLFFYSVGLIEWVLQLHL